MPPYSYINEKAYHFPSEATPLLASPGVFSNSKTLLDYTLTTQFLLLEHLSWTTISYLTLHQLNHHIELEPGAKQKVYKNPALSNTGSSLELVLLFKWISITAFVISILAILARWALPRILRHPTIEPAKNGEYISLARKVSTSFVALWITGCYWLFRTTVGWFQALILGTLVGVTHLILLLWVIYVIVVLGYYACVLAVALDGVHHWEGQLGGADWNSNNGKGEPNV